MQTTQQPRPGKITRRLFWIFLLFALVPTCILSGLALRYISQTTTGQIEQLLTEETDAFHDMLQARLGFISERLGLHAAQLAAGNLEQDASALPHELIGRGIDFELVEENFLEAGYGIESLTSARVHLAAGKSLLLRKHAPGERDTVYMVRALEPGDLGLGFAAARIVNDNVLDEEDDRDLSLDSCVFNEWGETIFYSDTVICDTFADRVGGGEAYRGSLSGTVAERDYYGSFRGVFLRINYGADEWRIGVFQPQAEMFAAANEFTYFFIAVASIVVLSLSLVSIVLIRRQMSPLPSIMAGIERVAHKDYSEAVSVSSGDEFEELAQAFNTMSGRVSHQLVTMASMSAIDQMILSRVKKEDILQIVLEKTCSVLPGDYIAMLLLEKDGSPDRLYQLEADTPEQLEMVSVQLEDSERRRAVEEGPHLIRRDEGRLPAFIEAASMPRCDAYQILPIRLDGELIAIILLGFMRLPQLEEDDLTLALNYADRIAVALSNAEWEERLFRQAHYDSLTGLPNRLAFLDRLGQQITRSRREDQSFGVLFIDLDNFKLVNDTLGHPVGDKFIQAIADRFSGCLRAGDTVSRLGGDEFVIVSSGTGAHGKMVAAMNTFANRILAAANTPLTIDGHEIRGGASIGIALFPKDGGDAETLLRNADTAMYHSKSLGRGSFQFFSQDLNEQLVQLMRLSTELRTALDQDQFELYYQPKVGADSGEIVGAEALIRWNHPERGLVSPGEFIDAAENLGLVTAIGDWTLVAACRQLKAWVDSGLPPVRVSVNMSAIQIQQEDVYGRVRELLEEYGISGEHLELEITEGVLLDDMETTVEVLNRVRTLGLHVSIDDYGTGYSSLTYMKHLPVNTLKIDRCFVIDLCDDPADQAIVNSTIVLARNLGMKVIAEGVETAGQLAMLQSYGCDEIQGYYFSRPLPEPRFTELLGKGGVLKASA